jgi:HEXXH motif-containing protein
VTTPHLLSEAEFVSLATGTEDYLTVRGLRDAQYSQRIMLLRYIARDSTGTDREALAFRDAYKLLARLQVADSDAYIWLLSLPHLAAWAHHCLKRLNDGCITDLGHFACLVAAAAVRIGMPFELDVPVLGGYVFLPGLGSLRITGKTNWIRLRCDGDRVSTGGLVGENHCRLVPDDGFAVPAPQWSGTPLIRARTDDLVWEVYLEHSYPFLDCYRIPMAMGLSPADLRRWRLCLQAAWEILVRHHRGVAEPMATGISVIVPIALESGNDLVSATSEAVFGAIAISWPPDPVTMAETLVHEFQHVKLVGLMDMVPLVEAGDRKVYAPWRQDPRPARSLLQGIYAHLGIAHFWSSQQHAETGQDDVLRAQVLLARWRQAVAEAIQTLLAADCLTPVGERFTKMLQNQVLRLESEKVPPKAQQMAEEVALDHWLTWRFQHAASEPAEIERLVTAFRQGKPRSVRMMSQAENSEDVRKIGPSIRSQLLNARYLTPARYRELRASVTLPLSKADALLLDGRPSVAAEAYRETIISSAEPQPDAWIGLSLALHQLPASSLRAVFADQLPLMFDLHTRFDSPIDPLDLARWLA